MRNNVLKLRYMQPSPLDLEEPLCAEREKLLMEFSRTAAEVSDLARLLWKDRGHIPKDRRESIRKRVETSWGACEGARFALLRHESEHGC
jgi:hypothetical protein